MRKLWQLKKYRGTKKQHHKLVICLYKAGVREGCYASTDRNTGEIINVRNFWNTKEELKHANVQEYENSFNH